MSRCQPADPRQASTEDALEEVVWVPPGGKPTAPLRWAETPPGCGECPEPLRTGAREGAARLPAVRCRGGSACSVRCNIPSSPSLVGSPPAASTSSAPRLAPLHPDRPATISKFARCELEDRDRDSRGQPGAQLGASSPRLPGAAAAAGIELSEQLLLAGGEALPALCARAPSRKALPWMDGWMDGWMSGGEWGGERSQS